MLTEGNPAANALLEGTPNLPTNASEDTLPTNPSGQTLDKGSDDERNNTFDQVINTKLDKEQGSPQNELTSKESDKETSKTLDISPNEKPDKEHDYEMRSKYDNKVSDKTNEEYDKLSYAESSQKMYTFSPKPFQRKENVEKTHTRKTFLVRNDLLREINKRSRRDWGWQKWFVNTAFEMLLTSIEEDERNSH